MKLYEYLSKEESLQFQIVWEIGHHTETLKIGGIMYMLYAINDFFVEVHYCQRTNKIIGKNQFKGGDNLDKYLDFKLSL